LTGLAPSYLYEIENEGANVTLRTLAKLAGSLKLGPRDLLPEIEQDAVTGSAVAELIAALDRAADVLSQRQSQEAELIARLAGCGKTRRLEKIAQKSARNQKSGPVKSMGYRNAEGHGLLRKQHRPTFSATC